MAFALHPHLEADTLEVVHLPLSAVRLMNDRTWPWLILVPVREEVSEIHDLDAADRRLFVEEIALASTVVRDLFQAHKVNVAALGNKVPQLHCHVIARFHSDPAWPGPVWGAAPPQPYGGHERATTIGALRDAFTRNLQLFPALEAASAPEPASGVWAALGFTDR